MFLCEKTKSVTEKSNENLQKTALSGIFQEFSAVKKLSQKSESAMFFIPNMHLCAKNQKKLMSQGRSKN